LQRFTFWGHFAQKNIILEKFGGEMTSLPMQPVQTKIKANIV
jgi:hypothetical protein